MKENQDCNLQSVYQQIVEISKKYQVKKVVLFGSRARGTNMPKSDIDLAIYGCAAVYDAQRSPFCFRTAVFRSQRPPIFS